jgi:hypothetical protein
MTITLAESTRLVALMVGEVFSGVATGGSATTLDDTACVDYPDDFWNGGTIWLTGGNNSGKTALITDWDLTTNKRFTFATLTLLCAAGDTYTVCSKNYSRQALRNAINQALADTPRVTQLDATLVGVADQLQYTLPSGVSGVVRVANGVSPTFQNHYRWNEYNGKLYLDPGAAINAGDTINLWYNPPYTALTSDTGTIPDLVPWERVKLAAAVYALRERYNRVGDSDGSLKAKLTEMMQQSMMAKASNPVTQIHRDPHLGGY